MSWAQGLMIASAAVTFVMGLAHLLMTFASQKFHPHDPQTEVRMKEDSPQLTRRTTLWRAWVGFNASHSLGAMLFGAVYGFLALAHAGVLFHSPYLKVLGLLMLLSYLLLAWLYWFSAPFRGLLLATLLYVTALALA